MNYFSQDPLDFEWSFWTEWAKKSLLWTFFGHGVTSRLTSIFYPKVRSSCCTVKYCCYERDVLFEHIFFFSFFLGGYFNNSLRHRHSQYMASWQPAMCWELRVLV